MESDSVHSQRVLSLFGYVFPERDQMRSMRIHGRWMKAPDPFILEFLEEVDLASPTDIATDDRISFTRTYINKRLKDLERHEMVQNMGNGMYRITENGSAWLAGEFDPRTDEGNQAEAAV